MGADGDIDDTRYDPFRRDDVFGEVGHDKQPVWRRLSLFIRACLLLPVRLVGCALGTVAMRLVAAIIKWVPCTRGLLLAPAASLIARCMLFMSGVVHVKHVNIATDPDRGKGSNGGQLPRGSCPIIVTNHVSWLDILMVSAYYSCAYVTKIGVKRVPLIGGICDSLPCLYVDRDKASGTSSTTEKIVSRAREKHRNPQAPHRPLCVFAEGTTTNGRYLLPFKTGAFVPGVPIKPLLLSYKQRHGSPSLSWETISPQRHLFLVFTSLFHTACIAELPMYTPSAAEQADAQLYAKNVHAYMLKWSDKLGFGLQASASTYTEKKEYHKLMKAKHGMNS